jgi:PAS domain S-box-containing protein
MDEAQKHLVTIVDATDDVIIGKDAAGLILSWNLAAERVLGYTEAELIGQSIRLIWPPELQDEEQAVLTGVLAGRGARHYETLRLHKDGHRVPMSVTISPITTPQGEIVGTYTIAQDVTTSRRLERDARHLAAIVDSSDDAIVSKDLDGVVISWNAAAEAMFGYSADEMIGRSIRHIIPADRQQEEDEVLRRIRAGQKVEHYETVRERKDGGLVAVSLTVSPIRDEYGTVVGASKIARDISERQRAEQERQHLLGIARSASRLKDEFLATLSHELRTPLNAIVGYLRIMHSGLITGEKQRRAMDIVVRNARSLSQIVEDVLDVSRITSGKLRLEMQSVALPPLIEEAVETVRPAAEAKGVRVETILDQDAGPVSGDPERLRQIVWNLCSNAVKFTNRGGQVEVRLERTNADVEIVVSDTGIGIAPEFLPHVFERFRQEDGGINRALGGLGLGLAISRHLVELQGGRIFAASDGPGKGSTFRVELPLRDPRNEYQGHKSQPPAQSTAAVPIVVPTLHGVRVLAVDNDRDALALVREVIEATGASVVTADSAQDAWEKLNGLNMDILLADLGMPGMDGFELIARVRHSDRVEIAQIPAVALTAFARSEDRARALRSGFQLHLAKPIDPADLMAAVEALAKRGSATAG